MNPQNEEIEKVNHQTLKAKEGNPSNIPKIKTDISLKIVQNIESKPRNILMRAIFIQR